MYRYPARSGLRPARQGPNPPILFPHNISKSSSPNGPKLLQLLSRAYGKKCIAFRPVRGPGPTARALSPPLGGDMQKTGRNDERNVLKIAQHILRPQGVKTVHLDFASGS